MWLIDLVRLIAPNRFLQSAREHDARNEDFESQSPGFLTKQYQLVDFSRLS